METRKVRIGIDVGGTFTDAVVVDNTTFEVIAKTKVPTTHNSKQGVSEGIILAINKVLEENNISTEDIVFIAHGTTQATNALLEGDVAKVGIIGMGKGIEASRSKNETIVGNIELSSDKYLYTQHRFIDSSNIVEDNVIDVINQLKQEGSKIIVASESYSVDNPVNEKRIIEIANSMGVLATGGYEISQLYGLQARTRTAAVNASLIPTMLETANMTETAVKDAGIKKQLMIMRCDGGVMSVDEVRKRPILTMLSGLAAGVAGALMYEKITDGIFLEVGGTSTDISAIKEGKVMIKNAEIGGKKLYLTSLDVRTLGIAGGSMIVIENGKISDVGPRSAHIAEKEYEVFVSPERIKNPKIELIAPKIDDKKNYAIVSCDDGESFALTLAGAANILGYVPYDDYAKGNIESARLAWSALAEYTGEKVEVLCEKALQIACNKVKNIVDSLIDDYNLNKNIIFLVGGGGSASIITPYLSKLTGVRFKIAKNAPYISTIGVSLALLREQIERNISNPTEEDIKKIRHDCSEMIIKSGADPKTIEITIEIDSKKNILRGIATAATELRTKDRSAKTLTQLELKEKLLELNKENNVDIKHIATTGKWNIFELSNITSSFFGLIKSKKTTTCVIDDEGVIRLQKQKAKVLYCKKEEINMYIDRFIDSMTIYSDANETLPNTFVYFGQKSVDLSSITTKEQMLSILNMEIEYLDGMENILIICSKD